MPALDKIDLAVIVAVAENAVVGRDNALPWHLPADLRHFKQTTLGKPIVMGRKTFESIGRPLPGRTNIVISTNPDFLAPGITAVGSIEQALIAAQDVATSDACEELFVIGGASIYVDAIPLADRLYITEVHAQVAGDVSLPAIDWSVWQETRRERYSADAQNQYDYSFVVYERVLRESPL